MKSKVLAAAAIICMLCCSTASAQWPLNTYGNQSQWEVEIGTRILDRPSSDQNFNLVTLVPTNATVFNASDASDLDASVGADLRFLKQTSYDASWEFRGTYDSWDNLEGRSGNLRAPLFTPAILPPGSRPDRFDYLYESDVFSLELNYKRAVHPGLTLMIGPRYVDMSEQISIDSNFINPFIPGFAFDLDTVTQTHNSMPGLGLGMEIRRPVIRELFFIASIKGALLANFASTSTITTGTVILGNPVQTTIFEDSKTDVAGIGELSARMHYDISPGNVSVYCGYEAIWWDGVALAPGQLLGTLSPPLELNTSTTAFANGVVAGLMCRF